MAKLTGLMIVFAVVVLFVAGPDTTAQQPLAQKGDKKATQPGQNGQFGDQDGQGNKKPVQPKTGDQPKKKVTPPPASEGSKGQNEQSGNQDGQGKKKPVQPKTGDQPKKKVTPPPASEGNKGEGEQGEKQNGQVGEQGEKQNNQSGDQGETQQGKKSGGTDKRGNQQSAPLNLNAPARNNQQNPAASESKRTPRQ